MVCTLIDSNIRRHSGQTIVDSRGLAEWVRKNFFNLLHRNISMYISITVLPTFPKVLTRRICLKAKNFFGDHDLYSRDLDVWFRGDIGRRNWMLVTLRG